jgi:hypothetical protein
VAEYALPGQCPGQHLLRTGVPSAGQFSRYHLHVRLAIWKTSPPLLEIVQPVHGLRQLLESLMGYRPAPGSLHIPSNECARPFARDELYRRTLP